MLEAMQNKFVSAAVTLLANLLLTTAAVFLSTNLLGEYGCTVFLVLPFALGATTVLIHGAAQRRGILEFFLLVIATMIAQLAALLLFALEGFGCIIMAAPLWFGAMMAGAAVAFAFHVTLQPPLPTDPNFRGFPVGLLLILSLIPMLMGAERLAGPEPALYAVTTTVDIDAPPNVVWNRVISFPQLETPGDWVFQLGAAYPKSAHIQGRGIGAVRYCVFSTGSFVEPITRWEEARLLAFSVANSPPSMQEWSPYENLHPPHVEGYFVSKRGQFQLTPLPGGHTRLSGTTWYQNHMSPEWYWRLWTNAIIHRIHGNVLQHIKALAEADAKRASGEGN